MRVRNIISLLGIFLSLSLWAKDSSVTLQSSDKDRVIVRYDVTINKDGTASISILNVQKRLGVENRDRYRQYERVKVLFFDKSGGYSEDKFKSDIATEALMISSDEISYTRSADGIVWLDEQPELKVKLLTESSALSIPVYLAYYEKKHRYKVIASCGNFTIPLSLPHNEEGVAAPQMGKRTRTLTTTEEIEQETDLPDTEIAALLMERIQSMLDQSSLSSMPDGIESDVSHLRQLELTITDRDVKAKIDDLLRKVETKKSEVNSSASRLRMQEEAEAIAKAEETEARRNMDYLKERLENISKLSESDIAEMKSLANELRRQSHSVTNESLASEMKSVADRCDVEAKKIDESKKRRTIWMIIGGILLAIIMFVGNQFFQYFRNLRSQKGIEEMQARIVKQAESDAKRRARGLAHNHMAMMRNKARGNAVKAVNSGINNVTKGKGKKVTI